MTKKISHIKQNPHPEKEKLASKGTPDTSRRSFFRKIWGWVALAAGVELAGLSIPFISSGRKKQKKEETGNFIEIAQVSDVPVGSVLPYRSGRLYICHLEDGGFLAVSIKCTHLGCSVEWDEEKKEFICPCHHSMFSLSGEVVNPPATRALNIYPIKIENDVIKVNLEKPILRKHFNKSQETYA
ncbi:MAG TPA: ubiquinol-cytochrome c reductase iron-sulfur subunit [Bacteroidetes bacterium]|nr:ubiquinol-cytochrome c reductase iron-sulfur subunit [Bacteroidota bacterium]